MREVRCASAALGVLVFAACSAPLVRVEQSVPDAAVEDEIDHDDRPLCPPVIGGLLGFTSKDGVVTGGGPKVLAMSAVETSPLDARATGLTLRSECDSSRSPIVTFRWTPAARQGTEQRLVVSAYGLEGLLERGLYAVSDSLSTDRSSQLVQSINLASVHLTFFVATRLSTGAWVGSEISDETAGYCAQDWCR